jgi:hypothetical protein
MFGLLVGWSCCYLLHELVKLPCEGEIAEKSGKRNGIGTATEILTVAGILGLTEAVFVTALAERSRLIVALTEAVALPVSINRIKKQNK